MVFLVYCWITGAVSSPSGSTSQQTSSSSANGDAGGSNGGGGGEVTLKDSNWLKGYEPSCDELRAMWRFSKRQSRASEITNEIPTYRGDPFLMNLWQPNKPVINKQTSGMSKNRAIGRFKFDKMGKLTRNSGYYNARSGALTPALQSQFMSPVYGRVVHKEPELDFGIPVQAQQMPRRVQYRFPGPSPVGGSMGGPAAANAVVARMTGSSPVNLTPQRGSFQKLKELVWTERARELAQQRRNEEMVARAAVLKELANGGHK